MDLDLDLTSGHASTTQWHGATLLLLSLMMDLDLGLDLGLAIGRVCAKE